MTLWAKMKKLAKDHIEENKKLNEEISKMSDKELKQRAIRQGGKFADAWVQRQKAKKELERRVKS